jgi:hypothetical protein
MITDETKKVRMKLMPNAYIVQDYFLKNLAMKNVSDTASV